MLIDSLLEELRFSGELLEEGWFIYFACLVGRYSGLVVFSGIYWMMALVLIPSLDSIRFPGLPLLMWENDDLQAENPVKPLKKSFRESFG